MKGGSLVTSRFLSDIAYLNLEEISENGYFELLV